MIPVRQAVFGLVALPALLALKPVADSLSFHPDEGSSLEKTFGLSLELNLEDATMLVDGNDMGGMILNQFPGVEAKVTTVVQDTYEKMGEGRPLDLVRLFESMMVEYDAGEQSGTESNDDLEGVKVRFTWDDEDGSYRVSAEDDAAVDEEVLNGLGEDMDLRGLLPGDDVSEGDTWELEGDAIWSVLMPGMDLGNMMASAEVPEEAQPIMSFLEDELGNLMSDFTFSCEYKGQREEDGVTVGVVAVTLELTHSIDLIPMIKEMLSAQEVPVDVNVEYADVELEMSGQGEMTWNLEGGHVHAFDLDTDASLYLDSAASVDMNGQVQETEASFEFSSAMNWNVTSK